MTAQDIKTINAVIASYLEETGKDSITANEASELLAKKHILSYSTKGQRLRDLLRAGKIHNAIQPGGKNTPWYILRSISKSGK